MSSSDFIGSETLTPNPIPWEIAMALQHAVATSMLEAEKEQMGTNLVLKAVGATRKGRILKIKPKDAFIEQLESDIPPGARVRVVSRGATRPSPEQKEVLDSMRTHFDRSYNLGDNFHSGTGLKKRFLKPHRDVSIVEGEVKSVAPESKDSVNPVISVTLTAHGRVFTTLDAGEELELVRPGRKAPRRFLEVLEDPGEETPKALFLSGEFPIAPAEDVVLETKEGLDETQQEIYGRALLEEEGGDLAFPVLFMHGGPGSGKTTVSCDIVQEHIARGKKVLVISDSNKGVDVLALILKSRKVPVHRAGNDASVVDSHLHKDRIRRGVNFPTEALRRIGQMNDDEADKKGKEIGYANGRGYKTALREQVIEKHEKALESRRKKLEQSLRNGGVVFSTFGTLVGLIDDPLLQEIDFDVVVIDEATRLKWEQLMLAMKFVKKQVIMVGDPLQLGNIPLEPKERAPLVRNLIEELTNGDNTLPRPGGKDHWGRRESFPVLRSVFRDRLLTACPFSSFENLPDVMAEWVLLPDDEVEQTIKTFLSDPRKMAEAKIKMVDGFPCEDESIIQTCLTARQNLRHWLKAAMAAVEMRENGPFVQAILGSRDPEEDLPYVFLRWNRRSLPHIVKVLSALIYDGKLIPGRTDPDAGHEGVVQWVDTSQLIRELGDERHAGERTTGTSKKNGLEADIIVTRVMERIRNGEQPENIAVIAMYGSQAELIRDRLARELGGPQNQELLKKLLPRIGTVDAYQGSEAKIVYVSLTRSNLAGKIGFLEEKRRLGVAIGRATDEIILVGDVSTLVDRNTDKKSQAVFGQLRDLVQQEGEVISEPRRPLSLNERHARQAKRKRWRANRPKRREKECAKKAAAAMVPATTASNQENPSSANTYTNSQ